jgi:hypothetical protein
MMTLRRDELGLLVWEEIPGWQSIGNAAWHECAVRDVGAMVRRDRNRPSVVIWAYASMSLPTTPNSIAVRMSWLNHSIPLGRLPAP